MIKKNTAFIKTLALLFSLLSLHFVANAQESFISTWDVPAGTVCIPFSGIVDTIQVDWGDGKIDTCTSASLSTYYGKTYVSHIYNTATTGETITISPLHAGEFTNGTSRFTLRFDYMPGSSSTPGYYRSYFKNITQWGENQWETLENMFWGCYFTDITASDQPKPYTANGYTISARGMFRNCRLFTGTSSNLAWPLLTEYINDMYEMFATTDSRYKMTFDGDLSGWNTSHVETMERMFWYCSSFDNASIDAWDVSNVKTMTRMFEAALAFNQDIPSWKPSSCTDMSYMFYNARAFSGSLFSTGATGNVTNMEYMFATSDSRYPMVFNADIHLWDVSSVETMERMFYCCTQFNQPLDAWGTNGTSGVSNVTNMKNMFCRAYAFNKDLSSWKPTSCKTMYQMFNEANAFNGALFDANYNTGQVTDMTQMFYGADAFNQSIDHWQVDSVTTMFAMFRGATSYNQDMSSWRPERCETMEQMFYSATSYNGTMDNWALDSVTNMRYMFYNADVFNQSLNTWDVSSVQYMNHMFCRAYDFNGSLLNWDVSNVTTMQDMFAIATSFNQDLGLWEPKLCTTMYEMFYLAESFNNTLFTSGETDNVTTMARMFREADSMNTRIDTWKLSSLETTEQMFYSAVSYNQPITGWDVSNVTNMRYMFYNADVFNSDINTWDVSNVLNMEYMFSYTDSFNTSLSNWRPSSCTNMVRMFDNAEVFNSNISPWNVSSVQQMDYMFANTDSFNVNLGAWEPSSCLDMQYMFSNAISFDTLLFTSGQTGAVKNMSHMFYADGSPEYTKFNQDIDSWDVSSVTTMYGMFCRDTAFNQDLTHWDVRTVTNMRAMFYNAYSFNGDISNWNVSSVTTMREMFEDAISFDGDLGDWDVSQVLTLYRTFYNATSYTGKGITNWDVSSLHSKSSQNPRGLAGTFTYAKSFTANLGRWDMSGIDPTVIWANSVLSYSGMIRADYDSTLIAWSNDYDFTNSTSTTPIHNYQVRYCEGASARGSLIANYGWTSIYMNDIEDCTAPGGVTTELDLWLRADESSTTVNSLVIGGVGLDGTNVTDWSDYRDRAYNTSQTTSKNQPTYNETDLYNFYPVISFNGDSSWLDIPDFVENYSYQVFIVQSGGTKGYLLGSDAADSTYSISVKPTATGVTFSNGCSDNGSTKSINVSGNTNLIQVQNFNGTMKVALNGTATATATNTVVSDKTLLNNFTIGSYNEGISATTADYYDGDIAEIVFFDVERTGVEEEQIWSYLAFKYGITLDQTTAQSYLSSSVTDTIWNADKAVVGGEIYNHDIFGIGLDATSMLDQRISKSSNDSAIVTISTDNDFVSSNKTTSRNALTNDLSFEVIANNGGEAKWNDMTGGVYYLDRIWQVQETDSVGEVFLQFDVDDPDFDIPEVPKGNSLYIVYDSDNDGSLVGETPYALMKKSSGLYYTAAAINFTDGQLFTISSQSQAAAPGGVVAGLSLWLRADDDSIKTVNDSITYWDDYYNGQVVTSYGPTLTPNAHNFNPGATFSGDDYVQLFSGFADFTEGITSFVFANPSTNNNYAHFFTLASDNTYNHALMFRRNGTGTYMRTDVYTGTSSAEDYITSDGLVLNEDNVYGFYATGGEPSTTDRNSTCYHFKNGGLLTASTDNLTFVPANEYRSVNYVGCNYNATNNYFNGDMPEVILYKREITNIERLRVNSYLAIKYGLSLTQDNDGDGATYETLLVNPDITEGDYLASDSTVVWDAQPTADVSDTIYNHNVMGIALDSLSRLNQRISHSTNEGTVVTIATDKEFLAANDTNRTAIGDDMSFFMIGDNDSTYSASKITDLPTGYDARTNRQWRIQVTGYPAGVYFKIDTLNFAPTNCRAYYLVASTKEDFSDIVAEIKIDKNNETESSLTLLAGTYYLTLAMKANIAPGGVKSGVALWLRADQGFGTNNAAEWTDFFNGDSCTINGAVSNPNAHNFNPGAMFDGDDYVELYDGFVDFTEGITSFVFANPTLNNNLAYFFTLAASNTYDYALMFRRNGTGTYMRTDVFTGTGTAEDYITSDGLVLNEDNVYGFYATGGEPSTTDRNSTSYHFKNGSVLSSHPSYDNLTFVPATTYRAYNYMGCNYNATNEFFRGDMPEVILYNRNISDIERLRVNSYLAIKYGLTLSQDNDGDGNDYETMITGITEGDYLASDSTVVWDAKPTSNISDTIYNHNIFGIGLDSTSVLDQRVSHSSNKATVVTIATEKEFTAANTSGRTAIGDNLSFVMIGDNDSSYVNTKDVDVPAGFDTRVLRTWRTQVTGSPAAFYLKIDTLTFEPNRSREYYLVVSKDEDFSTVEDEILIDENSETESALNLTAGTYYFTIALKVYRAPGGVFSELSLWLRADDDSMKVDGDSITYAYDYFSQKAMSSHGPTLVDNCLNFNPGIAFAGGTERIYVYDGFQDFTSGMSAFVTFNTNNSGYGRLFRLGYNATGLQASVNLTKADNFRLSGLTYPGTGSTTASSVIKSGMYDLGVTSACEFNIEAYTNPGSTTKTPASLFRDGGMSLAGSVYPPAIVDRNYNYIGGGALSGSYTYPYVGYIPEVILFKRDISDIERLKVNTYLAIKYGLTLSQDNDGDGTDYETMMTGITEGDYLASDSTVVWDASDAGEYNHDIFGIGRDTTSALYQRISKSVNDSAIVTLSLNTDFSSSNIAVSRTETINDLAFQTISNNGGDTAWTATNAPHGFKILGRKWMVQEANIIGNVYLQFDVGDTEFNVPDLINGNEYFIVIDEDKDSDLSNNIPVKLNLASANWVSDAIDFSGGEIFTLATEATPIPGGVGGDVFWYRADARNFVTLSGSTVTEWKDYSGTGNDLTKYKNGQPTYNENNINFNPALEFNGDMLFDSICDITELHGDAAFELFSVVFSNNPSVGVQTLQYFGNLTSASSGGYAFDFQSGNVCIRDGSGYVSYTPVSSLNNYHIHNFRHGGAGELSDIIPYTDNSDTLVFSSGAQKDVPSSIVDSVIAIGGRKPGYNGQNNYFNGNIAENFIFSRVLTPTERQKVQSYLALKYGITLDQSNGEYDYLASDSTVMWDASDAGEYNHDIFGIGRDDVDSLYQRISKSINDSAIVTLSTNDDFTSSNIGRTETIDDLNFLTIANNGGSAGWDGKMAMPNGFIGLKRIWQVQETGTVGDVYLQFDVDDAEFNIAELGKGNTYYLIYDSDKDSIFSDETPIVLMQGASANLWYTETPVNFTDGQIFTLASKAYAPGGVSQNLQLWVRADKGTANWNDDKWYDSFNSDSCTVMNGTTLNTSSNLHNFNPGVSFDGTNDYIDVYDGFADFTGGITSFVFANPSATRNYARFLDFGTGMGLNNITLNRYLGTSNLITGVYYNGPGDYTYVNTTTNDIIINNRDNIYGFFNTAGIALTKTGTSTLFKNGKNLVSKGSYYIPQVITRNLNYIAKSNWSPDPYFAGDIPEVITYNRNISAVERQKVNTYLAVKYGLTLDQTTATDYLASNDSVVWDATKYSTYSHNITGIGTDSTSMLIQKVSQSVSDTTLTIAYDVDFTSSNLAATRTALADTTFVVVGDDGRDTLFTRPFYGKRNRVMSRTWVADITGEPDSIYVAVSANTEFPRGIPVVIVSTDNETIETSDTAIELTQSGGYYWAKIPIKALTNNTDFYFTFGALDNFKRMRHGTYFDEKGKKRKMTF